MRRRLGKKLRSKTDSQDIVQEVFVKIVRACDAGSFREETKPAIWLWTIARNAMLDFDESGSGYLTAPLPSQGLI